MKQLALIGGLLSVVIMAGCAGVMPGPGQPTPAALITMNTIPSAMTLDQEYQAHPDQFEVLGLVEGSSSNTNILGLVNTGNGGYIKAIDNAIQKTGADGLVNCVADIKSTGVLFLFSKSTTVVRGLAIKRKP